MTRSKKVFGYAALAAATFLCGTNLSLAGGRVALVIGNAAYEKLAPLNNPVIDAERMAALLVANGFDVMSCDGDKAGCYNLDRSGMTDALETFELKARGADVALVFYAGHGMQTAKGNVLAPVNMELSCDTLDPLKATMLDNVMDAMSDARDKVVIIDACRNDPFQAQQCAQRGARSLSFGSIAVPESDSRFLLMSSTKPGQYAADGMPGAHSPFAESLFYWMEKEPNAYFDELLDRVAKRVIERSTQAKFTQVPEVLIRGGAPESCLTGNCAADPEAVTLRAEVDALKAENERSQEYEEIVVTMLRSAGYSSLDELPADQRDSFFKGIVSASRALTERNDSAGERALAALKQGDESAAEALFEQELQERASGASDELKRAAESARHIASLSRPKDVAKAAKYFGEAVKYDPNDIQTWMDFAQTSFAAGMTSEALRAYREASVLARDTGSDSQRIWAAFGQGDIVRAQGRLDRALEFYMAANGIALKRANAEPENLEAQRDVYASHLFVGDVQLEMGKLASAAQSYESGLEIARYLSIANPQNSEWQRDVSITQNKIGDVRVQQGKLAEAITAFQEGLDIIARVAEAEPNNPGWQRDVSISNERLGDASFARGALAAALEYYEASHAIRQKLAESDPNNREWQRDLSVILERIGDVRMSQGKLAAALESYRSSLVIREALTARDPEHTGWQRDVSVTHNRIGEVLKLQGNLAAALAEFEIAREIAEKLVATDETNTIWLRDISVSHTKMGDVRIVQGNLAGALESYNAALHIVVKLAATDLGNAPWQRDVSVGHNRVGDVLKALGDIAGALESFKAGQEIMLTLTAKDGDNTDWQRDLSVSYNKVGDALLAQGEFTAAQTSYEDGLTIVQRLSDADKTNTTWRRDLSISLNRVGDARRAQSDFAGALESFRSSLTIVIELSNSDRDNTEWLRDVSITQYNIGDVLVSLADNAAAYKAFEAGIEIAKKLVALGPDNGDWQRDLAIAYNRIGDLKLAEGDKTGASEAYWPAFEISKMLADKDPGNVEWQWDLYVAYWRLADAGHDTIENFRKGLAVIEKLQAAGLLNAARVQWIDITKQRIADAQAGGTSGPVAQTGEDGASTGGGTSAGSNSRGSVDEVEEIDDNRSDNKGNK